MKARYVLLYGLLLWLLAVCCSCNTRYASREYKYSYGLLIGIREVRRWNWEKQQFTSSWVGDFQYNDLMMPIDIPDTVRFKIGKWYVITPEK